MTALTLNHEVMMNRVADLAMVTLDKMMVLRPSVTVEHDETFGFYDVSVYVDGEFRLSYEFNYEMLEEHELADLANAKASDMMSDTLWDRYYDLG